MYRDVSGQVHAYSQLIRKHHVEKDCYKEGGIFGGRALAAWVALRGIPAVSSLRAAGLWFAKLDMRLKTAA